MTTAIRRPGADAARLRRAVQLRGDAHRAQLENYVELTRKLGLSRKDAAARLKVSRRTVERYESELRWGVS